MLMTWVHNALASKHIPWTVELTLYDELRIHICASHSEIMSVITLIVCNARYFLTIDNNNLSEYFSWDHYGVKGYIDLPAPPCSDQPHFISHISIVTDT